MKKRKELDALVTNEKVSKRVKKGSGSCSAHELLRHDTDSSEMEDFSVLHPRRSGRKKHGSRMHLTAICVPLCQFILVSMSVLVSGTLIWHHIRLREDLDILRAHLQKVEAGNKNTPEALHSIHSKLKQLDSNLTTLYIEVKRNVADISNASSEINLLKESTKELQASIAAAPAIQQLPKDVHSLSESVAGFGSKISALETTVKELKDSQSALQISTQTLTGDLDTVKSAVQELSNSTKANSTDASKAQGNLSVRELPIQSAIQETNQLATYVQKELVDIGRSLNKINATLTSHMTAFAELQGKVETINDAIIWIVNDTRSQNVRIFSLENYAFTNLTLRIETLEADYEKPAKNYITISEMQEYMNKTLGSINMTDALQEKNATNMIKLVNSTVQDKIKEQDVKIETMENKLKILLIEYPTSKTEISITPTQESDKQHFNNYTVVNTEASNLITEHPEDI